MNWLGAVMAGKDVLGVRKGGRLRLLRGRKRSASRGGTLAVPKVPEAGSRSSSKATTDAGSPRLSRVTSKNSGGESLCSSTSTACTAWSKRSSSIAELREMTSDPGLEVDDFDLDATVGRGAFGRVRVVSLRGGSKDSAMALKILEKGKVLKMKQVQHVKDEMSILGTVEHPFIVNLVRTFHDSRRLYLLMEFVNGGDLDLLMKRKRRLGYFHAKFYAAQCILALEYLHSMKIAYRDLKPKNTLIDGDGYLKLTDFGFAKVVEDKTFTVCGTPEYVAPEVIRSQGHGCGVDWWALGILVFEMLQGNSPFAARSVTEIYEKALAREVDYPLHFQILASELIDRLLEENTLRLGCCGQGAQEVKSHKWFGDIDWQDIYDREAPAPWVPSIADAFDASLFPRYPEGEECSFPELSVEDEGHFNFLPPNPLSGDVISV